MDIFEFAMQKEKFSENYYRELSTKTDNIGLKSIFNMLADEEAKHYKVVQQMRTNTPDKITDTLVLKNAKKVFEKMRGSTENFNPPNVWRVKFDISKDHTMPAVVEFPAVVLSLLKELQDYNTSLDWVLGRNSTS